MPVKTKLSSRRRSTPQKRAASRVGTAERRITNVAIIGAGAGGSALLTVLAPDPLVRIVGVAEINPRAPGLRLAKRYGIPVTRNFRDLLGSEEVDLIIDVTGSPEVERALHELDRVGVAVIRGTSAKFMWQLIEERVLANAEIKRHLKKFQELSKLYEKEAGSAITGERSRIACEIHDGLVQTLAGINLKLDLCRELIFSDPTHSFELLSDAKAQLKTAIDESRQVIFNLRPLYFESMELVPALRNYLTSYETQSHIRTELMWSGGESAMAPTTKIVLFRIVQEALSNVQKHAKADRITISLAVAQRRIKGTIEDNGIGFDVEAMSQDPTKWQSFGLKGIHERARLVGGTARVESRKGHGTRVLVDVPISPEEERQRGADQGPDRR
jgi:two-component system sensor histidine kinase DegS